MCKNSQVVIWLHRPQFLIKGNWEHNDLSINIELYKTKSSLQYNNKIKHNIMSITLWMTIKLITTLLGKSKYLAAKLLNIVIARVITNFSTINNILNPLYVPLQGTGQH